MTYRVMAADDEPIMRKAMLTLIDWASLDCELVYIAVNGQEAMQQLDTVKPDILILDIQMPGISGTEIAKHVYEKQISSKVILLTAYSDFSYAHQAIKYGVVDYVVKTGAFEGLVHAIETAKEQINKEKSYQTNDKIDVLTEYFFKSVFDTSLYLEQDIRENAQTLHLNLESGFLIVLIHYRLDEDTETENRTRTHKSLINFLHMVFESQMMQGVAVGKNMLAIVLSGITEDFQREMDVKCRQVIDMMENFMNMYVYIGISKRGTDVMELKKQYDDAEYAIGAGFFDEKSKISYYDGRIYRNKNYQSEIDKKQTALELFMKKGKTQEALIAFQELLNFQQSAGGPVSIILNSGIQIHTCCGKILSEYDKTLYDITSFKSSISSEIYRCKHVCDYSEIMHTIIEKTSEYVNIGVSRKNVLIYECEKYIEEHYEECISVADVARSIGASLSYLSRIFKEATGETIIFNINKRKVERAKIYLAQTDMKIYEIAEALGFENSTYFSHFFKKYTGISPKEYKCPYQ